jgi:hypothetical protein
MLDLTPLELILSDLLLLDLIPLKLRALPETIPIGCKTGGVVSLNSNPVLAGLGKNSASPAAAAEAEVQGLRGLAELIVKFGKATANCSFSMVDRKALNLFCCFGLVAEVAHAGEKHC